ncbi:MAG: ABC transporter substrate-binding protein [Chloroflexi bacterium]|nr:ABC transporter substrate-binding protein [Chloroflexota bacterium]
MQEEVARGISRRRLIELAGLGSLAAACGGLSPSATAAPTVAATVAATAAATPKTLPKPEKTAIKVGLRLPSLNQQAPMRIAVDKGYFAEVGFTNVEIITTEQTREGVLGGSLDVAHMETSDVVDAAGNRGTPLRMIAAHSNYTSMMIAVHKSIRTLKDLEGKDILLGGTPGTKDFDDRAAFLKKAGWDITTIKVNPVTVPGGSNAWVKLLSEDKLFMTPIFNRHRNGVLAAGHKLVVDEKVYGSDVLTASTAALAQTPNLFVAFIGAYIKALQIVKDLGNQEYVMGLGPKIGITVTDDIRNAWELDAANYRPHTGGFPVEDMDGFTKRLFGNAVPVSKFFDPTPLWKAQEILGIPKDPPKL